MLVKYHLDLFLPIIRDVCKCICIQHTTHVMFSVLFFIFIFTTIDCYNNKHCVTEILLTYFCFKENNCSVGFISEEDIAVKARMITTVDDLYSATFGTDRFYKDIKFTCDGIITHVIIGTKDNPGQSSNPPEVRFWRSNNDDYTQSGSAIKLYYNNATEEMSSEYLKWYNLFIPVPVQKGDVLGIYHFQPTSKADSIIYYQRHSGPVNYYSSSEKTGYNLYPLVSVVFCELMYNILKSIFHFQ